LSKIAKLRSKESKMNFNKNPHYHKRWFGKIRTRYLDLILHLTIFQKYS